MAQPKVSVIILHLRDTDTLLECLDSLCGVSYGNFDAILVHNGSQDAELEKRVSPFSGRLAGIIHTGGNIGFAKGNNIGIKRALQKGADYVLLLNDDTVVSPDFLDILVAEAERDQLAGMLGPKVLYFGERERVAFAGAKFNPAAGTFSFPHAGELSASGASAPVESDYIAGCALLAKKNLIEKAGLLDERFFLYWEDSDWGLRAKMAGFRCLVVPAAKIWHKVSASSGGNESPLKTYYKILGHLLFSELHAPQAKKKILAGFARDIAWLLAKSSGQDRLKKAWAYITAIIDHYSGRGGYVRIPTVSDMAASTTARKTVFYAAVIIAGLFFYFYYGAYKMLHANFNVLGQDFMHGFYAAGNFFNDRSIYSMPPHVTPYPYFPPITFIFMPFAVLAEPEARALWFLFCHLLIGISFWTIYKYGGGKRKLISATAAAAAMFFSTPLYQMLLTGNINMVIFSGLSLVYAAILADKSRFVPAAIAVFSAIKIFPAIMMGVFVRRRNFSACGYFILTLAAVAVVSFAVFGVQNNLTYIRQLPDMPQLSGIIYAMSLTFFIKLFRPGVTIETLFLANTALLAALAALWWKFSGAGSKDGHSPGMAVTDLFALTVIMVLVNPSSWTMYCAFFIMPFYFVVFSMLEGRNDFKLPCVFIFVFLFMSFWEILYYHLPLSADWLTARLVDLDKGSHPALFPLIFSMHFIANLSLFGWILLNYGELAKNIERVKYSGAESGGKTA